MRHLILGITSNCNLSCSYCEQVHAAKYMSIDVMRDAIDYFASTLPHDTSKFQISFYGGEPLLAKNIIREAVLYSKAKFPNTKIIYETTTNGLLVDDSFIEFSRDNGLVIALSHDGLSQSETRGFEREVNTVLDKLVRNSPSVPIMMTVHPEFVDTLAKSIEFFIKHKIKKINITPASGNKVSWDDNSFSILKEQMEKVTDLYIKNNQDGRRLKILPIENKIKAYINETQSVNSHCKLCSSKLLVNYDGKIYPCTHFIGLEEFFVGEIYAGLDYKRLMEIEASRIAPSECDSCSYNKRCSHRCACANHGYSKNLSEPSAFQCEYERLLINLADKAAEILINENNPTFVKDLYK